MSAAKLGIADDFSRPPPTELVCSARRAGLLHAVRKPACTYPETAPLHGFGLAPRSADTRTRPQRSSSLGSAIRFPALCRRFFDAPGKNRTCARGLGNRCSIRPGHQRQPENSGTGASGSASAFAARGAAAHPRRQEVDRPDLATKQSYLQELDGSDGTRTRDLRRDRPLRALRRFATSDLKLAVLQGLLASYFRAYRMAAYVLDQAFGLRVGHGTVPLWGCSPMAPLTTAARKCSRRQFKSGRLIYLSRSRQLPISSSEEWHCVASGVEAVDLDVVAADHEVRVDVGAVDADAQ